MRVFIVLLAIGGICSALITTTLAITRHNESLLPLLLTYSYHESSNGAYYLVRPDGYPVRRLTPLDDGRPSTIIGGEWLFSLSSQDHAIYRTHLTTGAEYIVRPPDPQQVTMVGWLPHQTFMWLTNLGHGGCFITITDITTNTHVDTPLQHCEPDYAIFQTYLSPDGRFVLLDYSNGTLAWAALPPAPDEPTQSRNLPLHYRTAPITTPIGETLWTLYPDGHLINEGRWYANRWFLGIPGSELLLVRQRIVGDISYGRYDPNTRHTEILLDHDLSMDMFTDRTGRYAYLFWPGLGSSGYYYVLDLQTGQQLLPHTDTYLIAYKVVINTTTYSVLSDVPPNLWRRSLATTSNQVPRTYTTLALPQRRLNVVALLAGTVLCWGVVAVWEVRHQ